MVLDLLERLLTLLLSPELAFYRSRHLWTVVPRLDQIWEVKVLPHHFQCRNPMAHQKAVRMEYQGRCYRWQLKTFRNKLSE